MATKRKHKKALCIFEITLYESWDRQALHTLLENNTITPQDQLTPFHALNGIETSIKEEEHFWHFRDEILVILDRNEVKAYTHSTQESLNCLAIVSFHIPLLKKHFKLSF